MNHSDIRPFLTYVRSEFLYSLKEGFGYFTPATVFSVSSYAGDTLKFQVIADDQILFPNVPVCALSNSKSAPKLLEEDCIYGPCPDDDIVVIQHEYLLAVGDCGVWNRDSSFMQKGTYMFTVEWTKVKQQYHLIELEDGNYILWSNEKITWGAEIPDKMPEYLCQ